MMWTALTKLGPPSRRCFYRNGPQDATRRQVQVFSNEIAGFRPLTIASLRSQ